MNLKGKRGECQLRIKYLKWNANKLLNAGYHLEIRCDLESTENNAEGLEDNLVTNTNSIQATEVNMEPARRRGRKCNTEKFGETLGTNSKSKHPKVHQTIKVKTAINHNESSESASLDVRYKFLSLFG